MPLEPVARRRQLSAASAAHQASVSGFSPQIGQSDRFRRNAVQARVLSPENEKSAISGQSLNTFGHDCITQRSVWTSNRCGTVSVGGSLMPQVRISGCSRSFTIAVQAHLHVLRRPGEFGLAGFVRRDRLSPPQAPTHLGEQP